MTPERWKDICGNIKDKFQIEEEGSEHIPEEGGIDIEYLVFKSPLGLMRLEHVTKPVILDKKTTYSKRIGSETKIDYIYSQDEKSSSLIAYKWDEAQSDWLEIDSGSFAAS